MTARRSLAISVRCIDISDRKEAEQILRQANEVLERRVAAAIAEQAEAEAQLRQAQKMEAVGKLTGGVAHDFNNVLQIIGGNLQLLARDVASNPRAEQRLQTAMAAVVRGSKLASQLLAFGRRQPLAPKVINLGRLLRGIDDMLRRALGEGVEIETVIARRPVEHLRRCRAGGKRHPQSGDQCPRRDGWPRQADDRGRQCLPRRRLCRPTCRSGSRDNMCCSR